MASCVFSIDVEDWFHILDLDGGPRLSSWSALESRVEKNFHRLLDLCDDHGVKSTCFFLAWIAERYPALVREAFSRGHEIASHGYAHQLIGQQPPSTFAADISKSKMILEDLVGSKVVGYRAPGFSVTDRTYWALDEIRKAGFLYDASIFPGHHGHGGIDDAALGPSVVHTRHGELVEFPTTVVDIAGARICLFGGGYLRLYPYFLIRWATTRVLGTGRSVCYYIHPRDLDPSQPRLSMGPLRRLKSYINLHTTTSKLSRLLGEEEFVRFEDLLPTVISPSDVPSTTIRPRSNER